MSGIVEKVEIKVEVPASMAGAFADKIKKVVGTQGTVEVADYVDSPDMTPGETLKLYREDGEFTQEELAAMLRKRGRKTTQVYVSQMESGAKPISKKMAMDLAEIFQTGHKVFL